MAITQQHVFKLGKSTLVVSTDAFSDGYANGFVGYPNKEEAHPLTVDTIQRLILDSLFDQLQSREWNLGYIVGAISGLREVNHDTAAASCDMQLGLVTLRLNRWRFREGYINGQADYEQGQHERPSRTVLTAQELLRYIAHYDTNTGLYVLGDEELCTLEETLGQLIGYLCSALFPRLQAIIELLPQQKAMDEA